MTNFDIPKGTLCAKSCGREATSRYGEHLGAMDIAHGVYGEPWCKHCILERQLEYSEGVVTRISSLRNELLDLEFEEAQK